MMRFVATCGSGLEKLICNEIIDWCGEEISPGRGFVCWNGPLESGYRACLWSRFASRVLLEIADIDAQDEKSLYEQAKDIAWESFFSIDSTFAVDCTLSSGSQFKHSKFVALRVKDAIVDRFRERQGGRPAVQVKRPAISFHVHATPDRVLLSLDLSGESMHRRGYRTTGGCAPLKETLAASVVSLSGWSKEEPLVDPMCGSGTLLIEAALMAGDSAPGLSRTFLGMKGWKGHDDVLWSRLVSEAIQTEEQGERRDWPPIIGFDADPEAVRAARKNIRQAGLGERVVVHHGELFSLPSIKQKGLLVCNPPYGERLSEKQLVKYLYRALGNRLRTSFAGWKIALFTSNPDLADMVGLRWQESFRLYNGPLSCRLFVGDNTMMPRDRFSWSISETAELTKGRDFANRLRKNLKQMLVWATKNHIECFRIYDRDLPEYNVSIDLYGKWVHIQEYAPPKTIDESAATRRFKEVLSIVRSMLSVGRDRIFIKTRKRQKKKSQYEKHKIGQGTLCEVHEGHCAFLVNFTDYLDTGLFLDHRNTRALIGTLAKGVRFLNLYGYTGSATIHAVLGGAQSTTTVDLSRNYLQWARMNYCLNGISVENHTLVQMDCLEWLAKDRGTYDLIFADPPTFSNTRSKARVFNVQKDHASLIRLAMQRLSRSGVLLFSTNFRSFKLDSELLELFDCLNISNKTVPKDFKRNSRVHQCWQIRHFH
jgi:23S rRNA (guanine2445-N2)-methyltransferase / 23S rRNA (guanine2069-N7)-methyltransferase